MESSRVEIQAASAIFVETWKYNWKGFGLSAHNEAEKAICEASFCAQSCHISPSS